MNRTGASSYNKSEVYGIQESGVVGGKQNEEAKARKYRSE